MIISFIILSYCVRAAVFIREVDILLTIQLLKKISHQRIVEMQEQNAWLYDRYFSSMEKITETTLEILADRVFPHLTRDYTYWNVPPYKVNMITKTRKLNLSHIKQIVSSRESLHHSFCR